MKPILFNTDMVRAILDGRKTVTRRVVKPQPIWDNCDMRWSWKNVGWWRDGWNPIETITWKNTPYRPGDILYVRETFHQTPNGQYWYKADNLCTGCTEEGFCIPKGVEFHATCELCEYYDGYQNIKWRPSIHMPREAARIFLRVTDVGAERLQEISVESAKKEGAFHACSMCVHWHDFCGQAVIMARDCKIDQIAPEFRQVWDTTIKPADLALYGWEANPWVWVIEFERISKEEALI